MPYRIDFVLAAKRTLVVGQSRTKHRESVAYFLLTRLVPVRHLEIAWTSGLGDLGCILQSMGCSKIRRIVRIDQSTEHNHQVACADLFFRKDIIASVEPDGRIKVVFVDRQQGSEAPACVRKRDRYRPGIKIENSQGPQHISVRADDSLLIDLHGIAAVTKLAKTSLFDGTAKIHVRFGTNEVLDANWHLGARRNLGDRTA